MRRKGGRPSTATQTPRGGMPAGPEYGNTDSGDQFRQLQLIQPTEIRSLLFAQAAVLCEGQTEVGALPRWWNNARTAGLPDLGATNVSFVGVDGHNSYRAYIRFLDAYGTPWVIVSDGRSGIALGRGRDAPPGAAAGGRGRRPPCRQFLAIFAPATPNRGACPWP